MATTTNYGWDTPDDTDLVKDGAAAIRTLGSSVDTTTKALNPSTTLGDVEYRSATANTNTRLGIGTTGQVLSVVGGVPAWTTPAGNKTLAQIATGTLSGSSVSITGLTADTIIIRIVSPDWGTGADSMIFNINSDSTGVYDHNVLCQDSGTSNTRNYVAADTKADFTFYDVDRTASSIHFIYLTNCGAAGFTNWESHSGFVRNGSGNSQAQGSGIIRLSAAVTSIQLATESTYTFSGGTYTVFGG
jgi:hypothetical protein